jgi:hypothetical protein
MSVVVVGDIGAVLVALLFLSIMGLGVLEFTIWIFQWTKWRIKKARTPEPHVALSEEFKRNYRNN